MFRRSLTAGLFLAILTTGLASAKPPDLPLPQNDSLAPAKPVEEAPLFIRVRPSVRRTMASCLLFGANPLLALAPTEDYVDFDADDTEPGTLPALYVASEGGGTPAPKAVGEADDSMQSVCPYMRQQQCTPNCPPLRLTEIDPSDDVLHNLEMLRQAQMLLQNARELGATGRVFEALQCLNLVHDLCPGGWLDGRIQEAAMDIFAACYCGSPRAVGAVEEEFEPAPATTIMDKLLRPVSLSYDETPLGQVIDDLRASQGLNIDVDKAALDADEVSLDRPISVNLDNISLKSALGVTLKSLHLTYVVKGDALRVTTERGAGNGPGSVLLRPCLPPVDSQAPAALDRLYDEVAPSGLAVAGGEEPEPSADVLRGVAKPFVKAADLEEVGSCKDAGAPISFVEVLKEFAAVEPPGHGELYLGLDGGVQMFTQLHRGGAVWHLLYSNGSLSVWASPDGGADAPASTEDPLDDDSAY